METAHQANILNKAVFSKRWRLSGISDLQLIMHTNLRKKIEKICIDAKYGMCYSSLSITTLTMK